MQELQEQLAQALSARYFFRAAEIIRQMIELAKTETGNDQPA